MDGETEVHSVDQIVPQVSNWISQGSGKIGLMANVAALFFGQWEHASWVGFYLVGAWESPLMLGPFQGRPVPPALDWGTGIVGMAARERSVQLVHGVKHFAGYLAHVAETRCEAAIPIVCHGRVLAVLDAQSKQVEGLGVLELELMTKVAELLSQAWCE